MPDTTRTRADLVTLLADNTVGDITAQDVRDFLASVAVCSTGAGPPSAAPASMFEYYFDSTNNIVYAAIGTSVVADWRPFLRTVYTQTADYQFVVTDACSVQRANKSTAINFTVPPNSTDPFKIGDWIDVGQVGAGQLTIVAGGGVTINSVYGLKFSVPHQYGRLVKTATDTWNFVPYGVLDGRLPMQSVTATGSLSIDHSLGEVVNMSLTGNVTSFAVTNWPATPMLGRLILNISNTGAFNITSWPTGTKWAGGAAPTITSGSGKNDIIILTTPDAGTTTFGSIVGQDYS